MNRREQERRYREEMGEDALHRQLTVKPGKIPAKIKCNCTMRRFPRQVERRSSFHAYTCPMFEREGA